jgi:hypothetical protein
LAEVRLERDSLFSTSSDITYWFISANSLSPNSYGTTDTVLASTVTSTFTSPVVTVNVCNEKPLNGVLN